VPVTALRPVCVGTASCKGNMGDRSVLPSGQYRKVQDLEERIPASLSRRSAIEYSEATIGRLQELGKDCSFRRGNSRRCGV